MTPSPVVEAHRGAPDPSAGIAENTLDAYARARQLGADGVELDVRLTADGAVAIHHDPDIPGAGPVAELTVRQLPAHVPLLGAALDVLDGLVVNVEVKNLPTEPAFDPDDRLARAVADLLAGRDAERTLVSSFWAGALEAVREADAAIPTGLLVPTWLGADAAVEAAAGRGCAALHPHVSVVTPLLVARAHGAGLAVAAWTVDDPEVASDLVAAGVDVLITDDVPAIRAALARS